MANKVIWHIGLGVQLSFKRRRPTPNIRPTTMMTAGLINPLKTSWCNKLGQSKDVGYGCYLLHCVHCNDEPARTMHVQRGTPPGFTSPIRPMGPLIKDKIKQVTELSESYIVEGRTDSPRTAWAITSQPHSACLNTSVKLEGNIHMAYS